MPRDQGNTAFTIQPMIATIRDEGSGVRASSVTFSVTDVSAAMRKTITYSGSRVAFDRTLGRAVVAAPDALEVGHTYNVTVNADDVAGNHATPVQTTFAVVGAAPTVDETGSPELPTAEIDPTASTSSATDLLTGGTVLKFENVPLKLSGFDLKVHGTPAHPGYGYVKETVDLTKARVTLYKAIEANGETRDEAIATIDAPAQWGSIPAFVQWRNVQPKGTADPVIAVTKAQPAIQQLTLTSPIPGIVKAEVSLDANASVALPVCANPVQGCGDLAYATPDPTPFYFSESEAQTLREGDLFMQNQANATAGQNLVNVIGRCAADPTNPNNCVPCDASSGSKGGCVTALPQDNGLTSLTLQVVYNTLEPDEGHDGSWDALFGTPIFYGLLYAPDSPLPVKVPPLYPPTEYPASCGVMPCTQSRAAANDPVSQQQYCMTKGSGIDGDGGPCYQHMTLTAGEYLQPWADCNTCPIYWATNRHVHGADMTNTKGWKNASRDHMAIGLNQSPIGWDQGANLSRRYYYRALNHPDDVNTACSDSYRATYYMPQSAGDYRIGPTNVIDVVNLSQGWLIDGGYCDHERQYAFTNLGGVTLSWKTMNPEGFHDEGATEYFTYAHDKNSWHGQWTCGGGASGGTAGGGASAGCSYSGAYEDSNHWERQLSNTYWF